MAKVLVAYFSRGGNTRKLAEAVVEGAKAVPGIEVTLKGISEVQPRQLLDYDGILLGSPVYYGSMAAEVKKLLDESVAFHGQLAGKVGGAFATSANVGGGNETTVLDILNALLIHGMVIQGNHSGDHYGAVSIGRPDERALTVGRQLGQIVATLAVRLWGSQGG